MTASGKRQLSAILFADIVGFTALMQRDESLARAQRDRQRESLEKHIAANNGHLVQYFGDGTLAMFDSSVSAVEAAVAVQQELQIGTSVPLRIGIHTGDVVYEGDGIYGDGVNVASRIESMSVPGAVLVSERVFDDLKNHPELPAHGLGGFQFKNVLRPMELYAISAAGLEVPDPSELEGKGERASKSIAVLPFVNMSNDPDNEYFSDGITEEILNVLTRVDGLKVTSRTSAFSFKNTTKDIRDIGTELGVKTVLEGSVRKAGNRVRITAQLIDVASDTHIWSEVYDRELEDIFAVQDEISLKIAERLKEGFANERQQNQPAPTPVVVAEPVAPTQNMEAYKLYLKGRHAWNQWTPTGIGQSIECYQAALELEPEFAIAHAGLAQAYAAIFSPTVAFDKAKKHAELAIRFDDKRAKAHLAMGITRLLHDWDWEGAESSLRKAIELNESDPEGHQYLSMYLFAMGRVSEAVDEMDVMERLDPLSPQVISWIGMAHFFAGHPEKSMHYFQRAKALDSTFRVADEYMGWMYLETGRVKEAVAIFESMKEQFDSPYLGITPLGCAYAVDGQTAKAQEMLRLLEERAIQHPGEHLDTDFALIHMHLGNIDRVFELTKEALDKRSPWLLFSRVDRRFTSMHRDPRYQSILDSLKLPAFSMHYVNAPEVE